MADAGVMLQVRVARMNVRSAWLAVVLSFGACSRAAEAAPTRGEAAVEREFAPLWAKCSQGDGAACSRLIVRLHQHTNEREAQRLVLAFSNGCAAKVRVACAAKAVASAHAIGVELDVARGSTSLRTLCTEGDGYACGQLAEIQLADKKQPPEQREETKRLLEAACTQSGGSPCFTLATTLQSAGAAARAASLMQRACEGGDAIACHQLALLVAEGSAAVPKDDVRATALYLRACDNFFAGACFNLAWQYRRGAGVQKDEKRAWGLMQRACTLGDASGCDELARRDDKNEEYCTQWWGAEACLKLAASISKQRGETADTAAAILDATMKACRRGHQGACRVSLHLAKDYVRECAAGNNVKIACTFAGLAYQQGYDADEVHPDPLKQAAKVAGALKKACDAGAKAACSIQAGLKK